MPGWFTMSQKEYFSVPVDQNVTSCEPLLCTEFYHGGNVSHSTWQYVQLTQHHVMHITTDTLSIYCPQMGIIFSKIIGQNDIGIANVVSTDTSLILKKPFSGHSYSLGKQPSTITIGLCGVSGKHPFSGTLSFAHVKSDCTWPFSSPESRVNHILIIPNYSSQSEHSPPLHYIYLQSLQLQEWVADNLCKLHVEGVSLLTNVCKFLLLSTERLEQKYAKGLHNNDEKLTE